VLARKRVRYAAAVAVVVAFFVQMDLAIDRVTRTQDDRGQANPAGSGRRWRSKKLCDGGC
jgi:hypothetical protein